MSGVQWLLDFLNNVFIQKEIRRRDSSKTLSRLRTGHRRLAMFCARSCHTGPTQATSDHRLSSLPIQKLSATDIP